MTDIYKTHKPGGDDGLYLKLKDGDRVKMRIASEPAITVYKEGDRPRYAWTIWNQDKKKAQVYNAGVSIYTQIADLTEEWGNPEDFDITIKRTGSGLQDTEYSVIPVPKSVPLTKEQLAEVAKVDLLQATKGKWLADYVEDLVLPAPVSDGPRQDDVAPMPSDDDAPINLDDIPF
jgi:hypothetical protein